MNFLLELLTEEIPARMQAAAAEQLRVRFGDGIRGKLPGGDLEAHVTPRRLILYARGLGAAGNAQEEERRGPRTDAPPQAIEGFVRSTGLPREQLEERETPKGRFLYATIRTPGRPAAAVIAELIPQIVRDFDWPKSMRWGDATAASPRWVRPLSSIVALLDDAVVAFDAAGIPSGRTTRGHRFMARESLEIASVASYAGQLREAFVLIDATERAQLIVDGARAAATAAGLTLIEDERLVAENAGLTEWPVPLLGRFDAAFLDVPREVIQLTMRTNQKYFACLDAGGVLAPAFVCVAGLAAPDGGAAIAAGNEKVLAARLADAKFFWDADLNVPLEARLPKLADIVFHERLGTVADKVERVAKLARWLVDSGAVPDPLRRFAPPPPEEGEDRDGPTPLPVQGEVSAQPTEGARDFADLAEQAARLCKADLVSATVGEFPEVQGLAGRYLALAEGLDPQVADAIRDHYKPVGPSDTVPTAPVSVAVALADKLDTLAQFFRIGEKPSGSRDPFALRRSTLGVIAIVLKNELRFSTQVVFEAALPPAFRNAASDRANVLGGGEFWPFVVDRLKVQQREAGIRPDIIDAVFALGGEDDLVRLLARVRALQAFVETDDGANLLAAYRRAANILRDEEKRDGTTFGVDPDAKLDKYIGETEKNLARLFVKSDAADVVLLVDEVDELFGREDFTGAMTVLSRLRAPVDAFFEDVMVNDPDPATRVNRLNLLASFRAAVHKVADFSRIV